MGHVCQCVEDLILNRFRTIKVMHIVVDIKKMQERKQFYVLAL